MEYLEERQVLNATNLRGTLIRLRVVDTSPPDRPHGCEQTSDRFTDRTQQVPQVDSPFC